MIYFGTDAVEVHLDQSYLHSPGMQKGNMESILEREGIGAKIVYTTTKTGSTLPDVNSDFDIISLPKIVTEPQKGLIGSHLGPGVRRLVKASHAPALISSGRFVDWDGINVFFGGSKYAEKALRWALMLSRESGIPLYLTTLLEEKSETYYREKVESLGVEQAHIESWTFWPGEDVIDALFNVGRRQLVALGAYGKMGLKKRLLGSTTELVLRNSANPLFLVGEQCREPK